MSMIKYRVHEVAKDFNVTSKVISQILTDYATTPKNHMQVLETAELDLIFEYMTQHNQVSSLEEVFNVKAREEAPAAKAAEKKPAVAAPAVQTKGNAPVKAAQNTAPANGANQGPAKPETKTENREHTPRKVAEKRVVDTRGGAAVNIEKYNEKFEDMAGMKARGDNNLRRGNKEKIASKNKQRPNQQVASAKRRQEERDKMNRLQLEIAKKRLREKLRK